MTNTMGAGTTIKRQFRPSSLEIRALLLGKTHASYHPQTLWRMRNLFAKFHNTRPIWYAKKRMHPPKSVRVTDSYSCT